MLMSRTSWVSLGISTIVAFVLTAELGSGWMFGPTVGWMSAVAIGIVAATLMAMRAGRPTRSMAHVLHDAEEQKGTGR